MLTSNTPAEILRAAIQLFEQQGYTQTSMRQIAAHSGVSLGLINHYFETKSRLGEITITLILSMITDIAKNILNHRDLPIVFDSAATYAANYYLTRGVYRKFYLDSLREDIFWMYLEEKQIYTLPRLVEMRQIIPLSRDEVSLYGKYMPYSMEKNLVLSKETGLFPTIAYDDIPRYILQAEMERFVSAEELEESITQAMPYVNVILSRMPPRLPREVILNYFESYSSHLNRKLDKSCMPTV